MAPPLPEQLDGFRRLPRLERDFQSVEKNREKLGCLLFIVIGLGLGGVIFFRDQFQLVAIWLGVSIALVVVLAIGLIWLYRYSVPRDPFPCPSCQRTMKTLTVPSQEGAKPKDPLGIFASTHGLIIDQDGFVYGIREVDGHRRRDYVVFKNIQRWFLCEACQTCFCGEPWAQEGLGTFRNEAEAQLHRDKCSGKHAKTVEFLDELAGKDRKERTFLEKLSEDSREDKSS